MRIHCWISDSTIEHFPDSPKRGENGAITRSWGNTLRDPRTDPEADRGGWNGRGKSHGAKKSIERGREPIFAALFFPQCHYYFFFVFCAASLDTLLALLILPSLMCTVNTIVFSKLFHCYSVWAGKSKGNIARLVVETIWAYLILLRLNSLNSYQCRYKSIKWSSSKIPTAVSSQEIWHSQQTYT